MKIIRYKPIQKGCVLGSFDLMIEKWGDFIIRDLTLFQKNGQRWITFPSRQYEKEEKTNYYSYNLFKDPKTFNLFQEEVKKSLDRYFENSGDRLIDAM